MARPVSPSLRRSVPVTQLVAIALAIFAAILIVRELALPYLTVRADGQQTIAATSVGPRQSSSVALTPDDHTLVTLNPEANSITVFNVTTDAPVKLAEIAVGHDPSSVAIHPDGVRAFVANSFDGTISIVNLSTLTLTGTFAAGVEPMALALSPNGTRLYVANSASNNLMVFNTTLAIPAQVASVDLSPSGTAPRAIAITNDGDADDTDETVFVALFYAQLRPGKTFLDEGQDDQREGRVAAISAATNTVLGTAVLTPMAKTFNGNLGTGFNSNGQLAPAPGQIPAVPSTNPQSFTTPTGAFPNQLASIAIQPGQARAYVVSTGASPNGPLRFIQMAQGLVSVFNTSTRTEISAAQTDPSVRRTAPLNLNQGVNLGTTPAPRLFLTNPVAMTWRPDGSDAWIAVQQSDLVVRLTVDAGGVPTVNNPLVAGPSNLVRVDLQGGPIAGKAPQGIVINTAGTRLYTNNFVSRSITTVNISNPTNPTIVGTAQAFPLPTLGTADDTAHLGEELFFSGRGPQGRMSSDGWGACVVCHPKGRSDNVTWMFDAGPRQTISLDGTFNKFPPHDERILNWSGIRDEVQDFELNTRGVFGGRGLIDDDRQVLAIGGAAGPAPVDSVLIEEFQNFTGAVSQTNSLLAGPPALPTLLSARRDFAIATLSDDRIFIIGGRSGSGSGTLVTGGNALLEFNPRTNILVARNSAGFTPRHSLGAAAIRTSQGLRIYAVGGYNDTSSSASPVSTVEEYNPATDTWRTVASLPTAVAQFGITVAGGINTADPLQLVHVPFGNSSSESAPSVFNQVQRFQPDPVGPGVWSNFVVVGLTPRRNHGAAAALRGVAFRIFVIGGQDAAGTVLDTVEEYTNATVPTAVFTPHTSLPAPRARFGIGSTLTSNQIYVMGGVDGTGADQTSVFEYTTSNNGGVAGPPGTPSGSWVTRGNLSLARRGLQVSSPPGVTNFLPVASTGRDSNQDAIAAFVATIRPTRAPVTSSDPSALAGKSLFNTVGLVIPGFSCATCHGGPKFTRSIVDYTAPPSPADNVGLGNENVIGAELRKTGTQPGTFPGVLINVGTFTLGGGRVNEVRANPADPGQAIAPLGANGFNIPSLFSVSETGPYFYSGLAQTLDQVLDGSQDGNGGTRHHFVTNAAQRAQLVSYLQSIDVPTADFSIVGFDSPDPVNVGGNINYTIVVSNFGPNDSPVSVTDIIPLNTTFVAASQNSGPIFTLDTPPFGGTGTFTASISNLANGATAIFTLTVNVNVGTTTGTIISNTAMVSSMFDPNPANNTSIQATTALVPTLPPPTSFFAVDMANNLVSFNTTTLGVLMNSAPITGLQGGEQILAIDFRPATGQLYGLGSTSRLYTINPTTAVATQVGSGTFSTLLSGTDFGSDFNPVVDRLRVVSDADQNLRINPFNGTLAAVDTALNYASGDPNSGANPNVVASAYNNNFAGAATTTLYGIDSNLDTLVRQGSQDGTPISPNTGQLTTIGALGVNTTGLTGLDIRPGDNTAYASLTSPGAISSRLYTINLSTGAATLVGTIGGPNLIRDIAFAPPGSFQLSAASASVAENAGKITITVTRSGNTSGLATVDYSTVDGTALQKGDYEIALGTLSFTSGQTSKSFDVFIIDDAFVEGSESFTVNLSNPTGDFTLDGTSSMTVTITDNDAAPGPNPIDNTNFFVRQQYLDFLNREPDPPGFTAWVNTINNCSGDTTQCDRVHVSQAFFQSDEFQTRGFYVFKFYPVSFVGIAGIDPAGMGHKPDYLQFMKDLSSVSGFLSAAELEAAKAQFTVNFTMRPEFKTRFDGLNNTQYVDTLLSTAGVTATFPGATRQMLIDGLNGGTLTRAQVLRQVVESATVANKYFNEAFVVMEYFGYLRRDPDALYFNWLDVLNQTNNARGMVIGFVNSLEYRSRFGTP